MFDFVCRKCNQVSQGFEGVRMRVSYTEYEVSVDCPYCDTTEVFEVEEVEE